MKKKTILIVFSVITMLSICWLYHFGQIREYNTAMQNVQERYTYLYDDFLNLNEGEKIDFETLNSEFAFFLTSYAEWEQLYRENYRENGNQFLCENQSLNPEELVRVYRDFRDLYYEYVERIYFENQNVSQTMKKRLNNINERFCRFFGKR